jgi:2-polyprenyl-6-methoxyphenol hydroxylase-like FAD-dependent oxidoreductase
VDQARDIAADLLVACGGLKGLTRSGLSGLAAKIRTDPHLFWLRGEVQPPGEWRAADRDDHTQG